MTGSKKETLRFLKKLDITAVTKPLLYSGWEWRNKVDAKIADCNEKEQRFAMEYQSEILPLALEVKIKLMNSQKC